MTRRRALPKLPRVFVSYVREDQAKVGRLIEALKDAGVDPWWDKEGLRAQGGAEWKEAIEEAIQRGEYFVACFSGRYWAKAKGAYMNVEIAAAIERLRVMPPGTRWFIPVRLTECEVPAFTISQPGEPRKTLTDLQWINLWGDWDDGVKQVIASVRPGGPLPGDLRGALMQLRSKNPDVRAKAVEALGFIGGQAAVDALATVLQDREADMRWRAADALSRIGDRAAVPALTTALQDQDADVRRAAARALGETGDKAAVPALTGALEDEDAGVRREAADSLGWIGDKVAVPALTAARKDHDADVRRAAAEALRDIRKGRAKTDDAGA